MKCPKCQFDNPEGSKFCIECGHKFELKCPQCGHSLPTAAKFCNECGHQLSLPAKPPPKELSFDEKIRKIQKDPGKEMKYKAIPILIFLLFNPILLSSIHAQPQIGKKTPGFITSTLDGKRIALKDYWEQQGKKLLVLCFFDT